MVTRKQITLLYIFDENWIGGTYYVINIVKALNQLDDSIKPFILLIFDHKSSTTPIQEINYPYIEFYEADLRLSTFKRIINKIIRKVTQKTFCKIPLNFQRINNLYPCSPLLDLRKIKGKYYWIPDFQERYLPHLFKPEEVAGRNILISEMVDSGYPIVFSSQNAQHDFAKFYPEAKNKTHVLKFVSILGEEFRSLNITTLIEKYDLNKLYFISPNQFWIHKNHTIVLKALALLKEKGVKCQVVFTGKEYDYRNPTYFDSLKTYVNENDLNEYVRFLGFIDRNDQLQLMNNSIAIIQPSLFEGWSTVVEDAKALNKYVILSNIPLHKEQIEYNSSFFDPKNADELADIIIQILNDKPVEKAFEYSRAIKKFANDLLQIVQ